jgi:uncharacterized membrane protein YphA (DoxX/SURF4 family)
MPRSASKQRRAVTKSVPPAPARATQPARRPGWRVAWDFLRGPYPTLVSRVVLGLVFLLAGISKAMDMHSFAGEISAYQMMPAALVQPMSIALPLLEVLLGLYLLAGLMQRWAAVAAGALLLVFIVAMAQAMARGLTLDCGCFGNTLGLSAFRDTVSAGTIIRDAVLLLLAIHLALVPGIWSVDAFRQRHAATLSSGR